MNQNTNNPIDQNIKDTLLIMESLSGKLIHDFANPMTGIMCSVADLETGDNCDVQKEALLQLKESSDDLLFRLKVMRQAYSSSADNYSFEQTKSNITNLLKKKYS